MIGIKEVVVFIASICVGFTIYSLCFLVSKKLKERKMSKGEF